MGCTVREKRVRSNRRYRSVELEINSCACLDRASISMFIDEWCSKSLSHHMLLDELTHKQNPILEESGWGYFTEDQLKEILLKKLDSLYNEAIAKLVSFGYDEDVALKSILRNGHCYGGMDVLANIMHNSVAYLNRTCSSIHEHSDELEPAFTDLRHLEEYSLAGMVCLLQQVRPQLSKGDAMWCLLMSDLHAGRASSLGIPVPRSADVEDVVNNDSNSSSVGVTPALCKFHGGWGFRSRGSVEFSVNGVSSKDTDINLEKGTESSKRFNLSASMKKNVAMLAAGFRANSKHLQTQSQVCSSNLSDGDAPTGSTAGVSVDHIVESEKSKNADVVKSVMSKFQELALGNKIDFVAEDQKDEMIVTLLAQMKDLEKQVKDRKEWAHEKAIQAAKRLSHDLTELKMLRMEMEEIQQLKKGKQTLDEKTMKRLSEIENALRKASGQVDHATVAVRLLQTENAEIRAEMEACNLSASESAITYLEVAKREKKSQKKLLASEKQKTKLQEEIANEKAKVMELEQHLTKILLSHKEAEAKWRQEQKSKDQALAEVEGERRSKEAAESSNKRKLEALRVEIDIDLQRHKDDLQRLEQELARLKTTAEPNDASNNLTTGNSNGTIAKLLHELDELEESSNDEVSSDRKCMICGKNEVSVVFLPCAHQVVCANCSQGYGKRGKAACPCCRVSIEQRIRVFGATS